MVLHQYDNGYYGLRGKRIYIYPIFHISNDLFIAKILDIRYPCFNQNSSGVYYCIWQYIYTAHRHTRGFSTSLYLVIKRWKISSDVLAYNVAVLSILSYNCALSLVWGKLMFFGSLVITLHSATCAHLINYDPATSEFIDC